MNIEQKKWVARDGWKTMRQGNSPVAAQLVFLFGGNEAVQDPELFAQVRSWYPDAHIVSASTAGEIAHTEVSDNALVVTAIQFDNTSIHFSEAYIEDATQSEEIGKKLAQDLPKEGLKHVMIFSDGLFVNGTPLVKGLLSVLPQEVSVTGGLAGDGPRFKVTHVGLNAPARSQHLVCVGFYGESIRIGYGSLGGWDVFGVERIITKSTGNILYELDGKPALGIYKDYLGALAKDLPSSGLLFPLNLQVMSDTGVNVTVARTILAVDEENQSMTFAGDMPEGSKTQFMKANFDRVIDGAAGAADMSTEIFGQESVELAILVSCVGRKLVLKDRVEEETEAVLEKLGDQATMTGFYSYGEICPTAPTERQCQLHNQTMTITTFREVKS